MKRIVFRFFVIMFVAGISIINMGCLSWLSSYPAESTTNNQYREVVGKKETISTVLSFAYYEYDDGCIIDSKSGIRHIDYNPLSGNYMHNQVRDVYALRNIDAFNKYVNSPDAYSMEYRKQIFNEADIGCIYYLYQIERKYGNSPIGGISYGGNGYNSNVVNDSYVINICTVYEVIVNPQ